jgi:uncharacterized membrane protein
MGADSRATDPSTEPQERSASPNLPLVAYSTIAFMLRVGLVASIVLFVGSALAYSIVHRGETLAAVTSTNPIEGYLNPLNLVSGLATWHIEAYMTLGILFLLFSSILRVGFGAYFFFRNREASLGELSAVVFGLLLAGVFVIGPLLGTHRF